MSKSDAFETDWLEYVFQNVPLDALSGVTTLYVSLHDSDPGDTGSQETGEVDYTPYMRVGVQRSGSGWIVTGDEASPAVAIDFPQVTGLNVSTGATHFAVGTEQTGPGYMAYHGGISPNIGFVVGEFPRLTTDTVISED